MRKDLVFLDLSPIHNNDFQRGSKKKKKRVILNVFCHLHLVYDSIIVSKPFAENIKVTLKRFDGIGRFLYRRRKEQCLQYK